MRFLITFTLHGILEHLVDGLSAHIYLTSKSVPVRPSTRLDCIAIADTFPQNDSYLGAGIFPFWGNERVLPEWIPFLYHFITLQLDVFRGCDLFGVSYLHTHTEEESHWTNVVLWPVQGLCRPS